MVYYGTLSRTAGELTRYVRSAISVPAIMLSPVALSLMVTEKVNESLWMRVFWSTATTLTEYTFASEVFVS